MDELRDGDVGGAVDEVLDDAVDPRRGGGAVFHGYGYGGWSCSTLIRRSRLFWWEQRQTRKPTNGRGEGLGLKLKLMRRKRS